MHALARLDASASSSPFHPNGSDLDGTDLDLDFELDSEDFALGESAIPETPPAPLVMIIPHVSDPDDPSSTADDLPTIMVHDWDGNAAHDAAPVAGDGSLARAWSRQKHHPQGMQTRRIPIVNTPFPVGLGARPPTPTPTAMPPR
ncbi:hypothetical protein BC936DRAFT_147773 [Jimgerdemannia flammicorona]|uniref:Uncharacterized protein n=1 Tax=Jimgerdemannia flammicorona TaxID=994334 RepID=A0A433DKV1_9FUNG|nr:hypothetical protein BC936DRAFT_147773 [Jimgerdemannia flammicorona]